MALCSAPQPSIPAGPARAAGESIDCGREPVAEDSMKFLVMIYNDDQLIEALPDGEYDTLMRGCIAHADKMRDNGVLLDSQMLEPPAKAVSLRTRAGRTTFMDGPFAEAKEYLGGFNLIEAADMDEALRIAQDFPWSRTGRIEVRPVMDFEQVRKHFNA
jgi:hypothetical protein